MPRCHLLRAKGKGCREPGLGVTYQTLEVLEYVQVPSLTTVFEPPRVVPAIIREIDLLEHRVVLEPLREKK